MPGYDYITLTDKLTIHVLSKRVQLHKHFY